MLASRFSCCLTERDTAAPAAHGHHHDHEEDGHHDHAMPSNGRRWCTGPVIAKGRRTPRSGSRCILLEKCDIVSAEQCGTRHGEANDSCFYNDNNTAHKKGTPSKYSINCFSCFERLRDDDVATHVTRRTSVFTL